MAIFGTNPPQEGDVRIYQTLDDGDVTIEGGITEMTPNFDSMAYLAHFGGNVEDTAGDDKSQQFWGNFTEPDEDKHYRSELQGVLQGLPASSGNLLLAEQAATRDLERAFIRTGIASSVEVVASIPARNKLKLNEAVIAEGRRQDFSYVINWEASA